MDSLTVLYHALPAGTLSIRREGLYFHLTYDSSRTLPGVCKLWLTGGGASLLVGTPCPCGGSFSLFRSFPAHKLERILTDPYCKAILMDGTGTPSDSCDSLDKMLTDSVLREQLLGSGYTMTRLGNRIQLSWPWRVGEQFPVPGVFCFTWSTGERLVLELWNGWPVLPEKVK